MRNFVNARLGGFIRMRKHGWPIMLAALFACAAGSRQGQVVTGAVADSAASDSHMMVASLRGNDAALARPPDDLPDSAPVGIRQIPSIDETSGVGTETAMAEMPNPAGRKIIHNAAVTLHAENLEDARLRAEAAAYECGGFIQTSNDQQVEMRVPAPLFKEAMRRLESIGEITTRNITSEDVTTEYFDIALRIEVAEASRKRLMELLSKSGEIKDVLEVEKEIRRLTGEIEGMKGHVRVMDDRIELATIVVTLQQKYPDPTPTASPTPTPTPLPVLRGMSGLAMQWLSTVGLEPLMRPVEPHAPLENHRSLVRKIVWPECRLDTPEGQDLPEGFIALSRTRRFLIGATPEDYRLQVRVIRPAQSVPMEYWQAAAVRELRQRRGYDVVDDAPYELEKERWECVRLSCQQNFENQLWGYDLWLAQDKKDRDKIYIMEFAASEQEREKYLAAVEMAVKGLR